MLIIPEISEWISEFLEIVDSTKGFQGKGIRLAPEHDLKWGPPRVKNFGFLGKTRATSTQSMKGKLYWHRKR